MMQETKLSDADAPVDAFRAAGYELAHHGEGGGTASPSPAAAASRTSSRTSASRARRRDVRDGRRRAARRGAHDGGTCGGVRVVCVYAPNGRVVGSEFYEAKLAWYERLARWLARRRPGEPLVIGGDFNVAPTTRRVGPARAATADARLRARARGLRAALPLGARRRVPPAPPEPGATRGGTTAPATSTRTSACASTTCSRRSRRPSARVGRDRPRGAEGEADPVDHAPLAIDVDARAPFDAGWKSAEGRIAARAVGRPVRTGRGASHVHTRERLTSGRAPGGQRAP
jgi:exodeoxyribonuclease-3